VIVYFVDIGEFFYHHCLIFLLQCTTIYKEYMYWGPMVPWYVKNVCRNWSK